MSDLPPSTIPPDEEPNVRGLPDEDDVKSTITERDEEGSTVEDEGPPPAQEQEEEQAPEDDKPEDDASQKSEEDDTKDESEEEKPVKSDDEQKPEQETESEKPEEKSDEEEEPPQSEPEEQEKEDDRRDTDGERDGDRTDEDVPGGRRRRRRRGPDGELLSGEEGSDYNSSDSEYQRELNRIGRKGGRNYQPTGALTTVLVSRDDDEKKRSKLSKTKTKKGKTKNMTKIARRRTRKLVGDKGGNKQDDGAGSSDDEMRFGPDGNAAFMEQYRQKKRLEHILDEQHYWSDPEDDKDNLGRHSDASSLLSTEYDEDEYEIITDENGVSRRVRKTRPGDDEDDDDDLYETIIGPDGVPRRARKKKPGDDDDEYETIIGPDGVERRVKKTGGSSDRSDEHAKKKLKSGDDQLTNVEHPEGAGDGMDDKDETKTGQKHGDRDADAKTTNAKLINVKGRPGEDDEEAGLDGKKRRGKGGTLGHTDDDAVSEFTDDLEKMSDADSGLDEDEGPVDVILTEDQQQMIVNMLFDEDMNLRPQFDRDEDGRIVRRLDGSVIYDPHTGRFTFLRRLGQLFKIPRLRRNDKGRPTGGYIQDEYGPKQVPELKGDSGKRGRAGSGRQSSGDPGTASPSADQQKRSRTMDGKNVGFDIPDEDMESMNTDQLEYHKRGRRDISSAIRRSLNRRLFRKKRKRGNMEVSPLPDVQLKKSWTGDSLSLGPGMGDGRGTQPGMSPMISRSGRAGSFMGTPGQQRRNMGTSDLEQLQRNREGLEHDRKILEKHYRPWEARQAFIDSEGDADFDGEAGARQDGEEGHGHGNVYRNPDGRLVIRERGCPDIKHHPQKDQFFTIVRRRRDLENEEVARELENLRRRDVHTAPVRSKSMVERGARTGAHEHNSDESLATRASEGGGRMSSIDDNRLRRLLEELYKDKKYLDHYIDNTEPKSVAILHSQGLAEHGKEYLLERADYWERRGPMPPRPPQTAVGWRMLRQQTMFASRESQMNRTSTTMTYTPTQESLPGTIDTPRGGPSIPEGEEDCQSPDGDIKITDDPGGARALKESEA